MIVNISYIECTRDVIEVYTETIQPRYYNYNVTFDELSLLVTDSKKQFSPFEYNDNIKSKDSWNNNRQDTLWLDFDDGTSLLEAQEMFKQYSYVIYTTKSHQEDKKGIKCDRFRVILPSVNIPRGDLYFAMMEELSTLLPIDKQVNTKTGSFLGNTNAEVYVNTGKQYDCSFLLSMAEYRLANQLKKKSLVKQRKLENLENQVHRINAADVKNYLDIEDTLDLLEELGYEVNRYTKKFKLRPEERRASAKIYARGYIRDFGGEFTGDILDILKDKLGLSFYDSMRYVEQFVKERNG